MLNNTKTQSRPKLLFLVPVPAISQTHKSLENSQDFLSRPRPRPRLWVSRPRPRPRLYFLSSRRLETKTLVVSRTTSLPLIFGNEIWAVGLEPVAYVCVARAVCACWRAILLDVSTGQSKFINKELAILLFTNTTSQMTSLTVSWLLVILNHYKNFERFSCTGFLTKFLSALKSLGANTVMLIT